MVATVTSAPRFSDSVRETLQNSNTGIMVSIIVPARNEEQGITKCLDSLVNQTYPNLEIIVVDDSSTDKTFENLKIIRREKSTSQIGFRWRETRGMDWKKLAVLEGI